MAKRQSGRDLRESALEDASLRRDAEPDHLAPSTKGPEWQSDRPADSVAGFVGTCHLTAQTVRISQKARAQWCSGAGKTGGMCVRSEPKAST